MECSKCGLPLRILNGGQKTDLNSTKITTVHQWGCLNPKCDEFEKIQNRTETDPQDSFEG